MSSFLFAGAGARQEVDHVVVILVTRVLVHLLAGIDLVPRNQRRPRLRPGRRILDREFIVERVRVHAREALRDLESRGIGAPGRPRRRRCGNWWSRRPACLPSQWPRESPSHWCRFFPDVRPPIHRNDARAMDHLRRDHHISGTLKNMKVVVVDGRQIRRRIGADDAAHRQARNPCKLSGSPALKRALAAAAPQRRFLAFRRQRHQRRDSAVRRIHDQRRAVVRRDFQSPRIHPVLVVCAVDVGFGPPVAAVAAQVVRQLSWNSAASSSRQNVFRANSAGPLQRRAGGIVPHSLQVRIAPRRMRHARSSSAAAVVFAAIFECWLVTGGRRTIPTARIPIEIKSR